MRVSSDREIPLQSFQLPRIPRFAFTLSSSRALRTKEESASAQPQDAMKIAAVYSNSIYIRVPSLLLPLPLAMRSPGGSLAWTYRYVAVAGVVVVILLTSYRLFFLSAQLALFFANSTRSDHESLPPLPSFDFDALPSLPFFKSNHNSSLFAYPPFTANPLRNSKGHRYSTHNCMGGQDISTLTFDEQTRCHFKNICLQLLPLWSEKQLTEMNETERKVATTVRLDYYRAVGSEVPIQWNDEFPLDQLDVFSTEEERAARSWTRLGRDSAVIPVVHRGPIPEGERWAEADITILSEAFWPENFGQ